MKFRCRVFAERAGRGRRGKPTPWSLVLLLAVALAATTGWGCGGSTADPPAETADPYYTFTWTGTVADITDNSGAAATIPNVNIGDTATATMVYDPTTFADGTGAPADMTYQAPSGGLQMVFAFSSGANLSRTVRSARCYDTASGGGGGFDRWYWLGTADPAFRVDDADGTSLPVPLPTTFAELHALFFAAQAAFTVTDPDVYFGNEDRWVTLAGDSFAITKN